MLLSNEFGHINPYRGKYGDAFAEKQHEILKNTTRAFTIKVVSTKYKFSVEGSTNCFDDGGFAYGTLAENLISEIFSAVLHPSRQQAGSDMIDLDNIPIECKYFTLSLVESSSGSLGLQWSKDMTGKRGDLVLVFPMPNGKVYISRLSENIWKPYRTPKGSIGIRVPKTNSRRCDQTRPSLFDLVLSCATEIFDSADFDKPLEILGK